ncbi:MAG: DUF4900 domain-containing protein [Balneolaceae bacterium]|nr:DUF4900 domain-containing protein [Balneolaceae bacterium]MBO6547220.1 DUF4900 domain-containing protein [Balneolaceae bacterium]MBO6647833.1 DUF4900 domain-containing protein [Balneolaceae bacterium]
MGKSLLFLVGGLTIITGFMQVQNQERMKTLPEVTSAYFEEQQARNIAKSLIDNAIEHMKADNSWTDSLTLTEVMNAGSMVTRSSDNLKTVVKGLLGGVLQEVEDVVEELEPEELQAKLLQNGMSGTLKSYTSSSSYIPPNNNVGAWDEYKLLLISTSTYDNIEVTTEVLMQRDSYSKYSYMTDSELSSSGSNIWFMGNDNIYGPIHTNGTFRMSGTPSFYGLITSPNSWIAHSTNGANPNFFGGENFNAPDKSSPSSYEINKLTAAAAAGGLTFTNQIDVVFRESGGVGYADIREYNGSWGAVTSYDLSTINGVISTTGRIDVEGVVKGQVTLHSESLIEIDGDITYFTDPLVDSTSTDMLGIVSEADVRVDANAHSASGSQDLDIHASIMALNTSFYVENYSSYSPRGTLNLLGGLIQKNRGPVGTFSGSSIVSGYSKNYQYDGRLKGSIPPNFPRESVFSIVYWKDEVVDVSGN